MKKLVFLSTTIFALAIWGCKRSDQQIKPALTEDQDAKKPLIITAAQYGSSTPASGNTY